MSSAALDLDVLRGISSWPRVQLLRWLAVEGVASAVDAALEWPATTLDLRLQTLQYLEECGWLEAVDGVPLRARTLCRVRLDQVQRLAGLLEVLDRFGVPVRPLLEEWCVMDDLSILRRQASRNVLVAMLGRGGEGHPPDLGLGIEVAWEGWIALKKSGWQVDGRLVRPRVSHVRALAVELERAVAA